MRRSLREVSLFNRVSKVKEVNLSRYLWKEEKMSNILEFKRKDKIEGEIKEEENSPVLKTPEEYRAEKEKAKREREKTNKTTLRIYRIKTPI